MHPTPVSAIAISPDGTKLLTAGHDGVASIWRFDPQPVTGDVRQLKSWVEVMTGRALGPDGATRVLDADTWRARREQLQALGGLPIP